MLRSLSLLALLVVVAPDRPSRLPPAVHNVGPIRSSLCQSQRSNPHPHPAADTTYPPLEAQQSRLRVPQQSSVAV